MKVLVVDDDAITRELLRHALTEDGHEVETAADGRAALEILHEGGCRLVVSDWQMPNMDGLELCQRIRTESFNGYVYFILLTRKDAPEDVLAGLSAGADDYVTKPFENAELSMRIRTGQRILGLETRDVTIFALAKLADSRDPETGAHLERVRSYSRVLAQHLADLPKYRGIVDGAYVELIYQTSPLHDIGKVAIPDGILLKTGALTESERSVMRTHPLHAAETLDAALQQYPNAQFLLLARDIAISHHEWWNGNGYPRGLVGENIPLAGRIVAVADVYDALTTRRAYKPAMTHEAARAIIIEKSGSHFDPDIVEAFIANEQTFIDIYQKHLDALSRAAEPRRVA